jgi:hypothetical protein
MGELAETSAQDGCVSVSGMSISEVHAVHAVHAVYAKDMQIHGAVTSINSCLDRR